MEECAKDTNQNHIESKPKKTGFFRRLKRGFTSIFQRKPHRKRNKSEPCLSVVTENNVPENDDEKRLSLNNDDKSNEKPDENGDNKTSSASFRPVAKAPFFVNDFTAELKKSLLQRSKMVEEGQTSEAIVQIEMTRSNYSTSEEENQKEIEKKTFEEKVALFESQISGGSVHNSLNRSSSKSEENKLEITENQFDDATDNSLNRSSKSEENKQGIKENQFEDIIDNNLKRSSKSEENNLEIKLNQFDKTTDNSFSHNKENTESISLEISDLDKSILNNINEEKLKRNNNSIEIENYEITKIKETYSENQQKSNPLNEEINNIEKNFDKIEIDNDAIDERIEKNFMLNEIEMDKNTGNCQNLIIENKETQSGLTEQINHGILIDETDSVQLTNNINNSN